MGGEEKLKFEKEIFTTKGTKIGGEEKASDTIIKKTIDVNFSFQKKYTKDTISLPVFLLKILSSNSHL
jgi:hypothetical protein